MKVIGIILLAIALSIRIMGGFFAFTIQKALIRKEVAATIISKKHITDRFCFSKPEYEQLKDRADKSGEFVLNGYMYDVISEKSVGNKVYVATYKDHKETSLIAGFISLFDSEETEEDSTTSEIRLILADPSILTNGMLLTFLDGSSHIFRPVEKDMVSQFHPQTATQPPCRFSMI